MSKNPFNIRYLDEVNWLLEIDLNSYYILIIFYIYTYTYKFEPPLKNIIICRYIFMNNGS